MKDTLAKFLDFITECFQGRPNKTHGSASWNENFFTIFSGEQSGLTINGLRRISEKNSFQHSAILAPSGAGKTTTYIIPNVLNLYASMVITDPSGEIYKKTKATLLNKFFEIRKINVKNLNDTFFYNPLERAKTKSDMAKIADTLISNAYNKDNSVSDASFWNNGAKTILTLIIQAVKKHENPEKRNLGEVRKFLLSYGQEDQESKIDLLASEIEKKLYDDQSAMAELSSFFGSDKKARGSFIDTAKNALEIFSDPEVCKLTEKDNIKFEDLKDPQKRPVVIFLIVPEHNIKYYSFLLNLFYMQVFNFCAESDDYENSKPLYFLLDEFGNMGALPNFDTIITTLRKRNCSLSIVLQDIKQLRTVYGKDKADVIFGNCASKIFFGGLGLEMCEKIERMLGRKTIVKNEGKTSLGRPLMTADEIRRLGKSKIIYIFSDEKPFRMDTYPYYKGK
jgi:type IV secretion system protein VirD4